MMEVHYAAFMASGRVLDRSRHAFEIWTLLNEEHYGRSRTLWWSHTFTSSYRSVGDIAVSTFLIESIDQGLENISGEKYEMAGIRGGNRALRIFVPMCTREGASGLAVDKGRESQAYRP